MSDHSFWQDFFAQAVGVVSPSACVASALPDPSLYRSIKIIAAGKAATAMAAVVEQSWPTQSFSGIAVCPYGHQTICRKFQVIEAAHPVPDKNSLMAAQKVLSLAATVEPGDLLLVLLSGGASSLLSAPVDGMTLAVKKDLTNGLLKAGAPIEEMNLIRSYYSKIKSGGLLAQVPKGAEVLTLAISDVVSDDPAKIGSGPTHWSISPADMVDQLLRKYGISAPEIRVPPREEQVVSGRYQIVACADAMLAAAAAWLTTKGFWVIDLGRAEQGEARDVAMQHVHQIVESLKENPDRKIAFLSGGELTVTVSGAGKGGPNQEYLLTVMSKLEPGKFAGFAADTDGRDGIGGAAGAFFDPATHRITHKRGLYAKALKNNDSFNFFKEIKVLFKVTPTLTNVNDVRVILYQSKKFT